LFLAAAPPPTWQTAASMPERRSYFAAAQIAGSVYVSGGMVGASGKYVFRLDRFDPARGRWVALPDQPRPARAAAGAAFGRSLYVIGGQTPTGVARRVLAYDTRTRRWSTRAPLPAPRYNAAAAALGGKLYVVGGVRTIDPVRTMYVYDGRRWRAGPPLPQALHTQGLVAFRGELWSIGGFDAAGDAVRSVWIYSPRTHRWRRGPRLAAPVAMVGATATAGGVYAVSELVYESYAPGRGWRLGPRLHVPRHALGLFALDRRLWAVGGCVVPELADSRVVESLRIP
jgi:N-acetylneuraminic acid mutarotase